MNRARECRSLGYCERHHVVPKCLGGSDELSNIVILTPEEHYVAHQLLIKMYPKHVKLAYAATTMAKRCSGNKAYGWLKRRHSLANSALKKGNNFCRGRVLSENTRKKIAASKIGKKITRKPFSAAHRAALSRALKGHKAHFSQKFIDAREAANKSRIGTHFSLETRRRMSDAQSARWQRYRDVMPR